MANFNTIQNKIHTRASIQMQVQTWRTAGKTITFTNGCFDLLHYGHIHYLAAAAGLADCLVVGLNSDASVQRLKGKHRPIKDEKNRAHILAALAFVDAVILFEVVLARGGEVLSLPFIEGYSTTKLEQKIKGV